MLAVNDQDICLLGGRNGEGFQDSIWIFSVLHQEWSLFDHFEDRFLNRQGSNHLQQDDCIWMFGGLDLE